MNEKGECVCLIFLSFLGWGPKIKGFYMMQVGHALLKDTEGLSFYKLMGTGKGDGFNPYPDFSTYALLTKWESLERAKAFLDSSKFVKKYKHICHEMEYFIMRTSSSHGSWGGQNPFKSTIKIQKDQKLAVLTRARIKISKLRKFWSYVPVSRQPLKNNSGLIFTKGIGEIPFLNMATFSLWKNQEAMKQFAYSSEEHLKAIKMTRELGWYREELFARFVLLERNKID